MNLGDVAGVFSRYFIVGFFVPCFVALSLLKLALSDSMLPAALEPQNGRAFLIIGAAALVLALLLLGMNYPLQRLYEGYVYSLPYVGSPL